jgi:hypothetical protein
MWFPYGANCLLNAIDSFVITTSSLWLVSRLPIVPGAIWSDSKLELWFYALAVIKSHVACCFGEFYFLPHFTWILYDLPLFTLTSLICHSLLWYLYYLPFWFFCCLLMIYGKALDKIAPDRFTLEHAALRHRRSPHALVAACPCTLPAGRTSTPAIARRCSN